MSTPRGRRLWPFVAAALALFLVWSNSFVAASYLLGGERGEAKLDWIGLSAARFATIGPLCLLYSFVFRRRASLELLRRFPYRLVVGGLLSVPAYNLALYWGQQHGIPVPVASLTTALTPLFVMLLSAAFLGEPLSTRKGVAFLVALSGLATIALSRGDARSIGKYGLLLGVTALAPLCWSIYSILSQPIARVASPLDSTFLAIGIGSVPLLAILPWHGGAGLLRLDAGGWTALLYLSLLCTLAGYAVWSWLLRHLPASSVGFFTFLNPPLASLSKIALVALFPAVFVWQLSRMELAGGLLALAGLAIALWPARDVRLVEAAAPLPAPAAEPPA
jgi:drug/metabolite transporter (DMT)-like permease